MLFTLFFLVDKVGFKMKLNLLLKNPERILNGYINVDPFADKTDERIEGDIAQLTDANGVEIVCDGEAEEIIAREVIEYFSPGQVDYLFNIWLKKLKIGGTLIVTAVDFEEVARGIVFGNIGNAQQLNDLIHGKQTEPWELKKTTFSLNILVGMLEGRGMRVLKKLNDDFRCILVAQRLQ